MQFKHKLIYFALGCAFVVIAQVLLSVVIPKVTAQGKKDYYSEISPEQVEQTGKYRIYRPTTSTGSSYEFLLNTDTGDCWRMVLFTDIHEAAWAYMPKEPPLEWDVWLEVQAKKSKQMDLQNEKNSKSSDSFEYLFK